MSSVWVILLDVSDSMNEGFSGGASGDPLAERGRWLTKFEAAKDLLLRQVAASRVQDVAVFTFADRAEVIYRGARADFSRAEAAILSLGTDGGTDLAAGLIAVAEDRDLESYDALSVLILSDGLSNVGDPVAAAERLIAKFPFARIDTILIDETVEGRSVAENVSINGSVRPALSILDLNEAITSARAYSLRQELAGFALRRLDLQTELALMTPTATPTLLTVTTPLDLTPASLREEIVPTLEGLETLERAASDAMGKLYQGSISSISQDSPVSISLSGFKEAVDLALEWVIPWRRRHAEQLAKLKLRQAEIDIEKATIENRQLEVTLAASKLELAERMLATFDPNHAMSDRQRQRLLRQFVAGTDQMSGSLLEFRIVGPRHRGELPPSAP